MLPYPKLNWRNCQVDPIRQANWTERTFCKRLWNEFESLWHHTTSRRSKQAQPANCTIPPPRRQTPGRRAGISAGGKLELFLCFSQTTGGSMNWTESKLNWTEALGPRALNWVEWTFHTNWLLGNWTILKWCQTILNFERQDLISSRTLPALDRNVKLLVKRTIKKSNPKELNRSMRCHWNEICL